MPVSETLPKVTTVSYSNHLSSQCRRVSIGTLRCDCSEFADAHSSLFSNNWTHLKHGSELPHPVGLLRHWVNLVSKFLCCTDSRSPVNFSCLSARCSLYTILTLSHIYSLRVESPSPAVVSGARLLYSNSGHPQPLTPWAVTYLLHCFHPEVEKLKQTFSVLTSWSSACNIQMSRSIFPLNGMKVENSII